jgi:glycosyltransferase involved in cell wall biosynthesis
MGEAILRASGLPQEAWSLESVAHEKVPEELSRQNAGLHFLTPGISQHAGSPTKVGEYWASGLPVVITPGVGDTEEIIRREGVGVVVSEFSSEAYDHALDELLNLLEDPYLSGRCRTAAEEHYGLGPACERVQELYTALVGDRLNGRDRGAPVRHRDAAARWAGRGSRDKEV